MSNLKYTSKSEFWIGHSKSFSKVFVVLFIMFIWIFESTIFGSFFWSLIISGFICGFSVYLTSENLLQDEEVMKQILGDEWVCK